MIRLSVKDIDFEQSQIIIREGKAEKDRVTILPYIFPSDRLSTDPRSGIIRRHRLDCSGRSGQR
jgi:hypothetical protein